MEKPTWEKPKLSIAGKVQVDLSRALVCSQSFLEYNSDPRVIQSEETKGIVEVCRAYHLLFSHNQKLITAFAIFKKQAIEQLNAAKVVLEASGCDPVNQAEAKKISQFIEKFKPKEKANEKG